MFSIPSNSSSFVIPSIIVDIVPSLSTSLRRSTSLPIVSGSSPMPHQCHPIPSHPISNTIPESIPSFSFSIRRIPHRQSLYYPSEIPTSPSFPFPPFPPFSLIPSTPSSIDTLSTPYSHIAKTTRRDDETTRIRAERPTERAQLGEGREGGKRKKQQLTNRIILQHTQRPMRPRPRHRSKITRQSHGDQTNGNSSGFRCCVAGFLLVFLARACDRSR